MARRCIRLGRRGRRVSCAARTSLAYLPGRALLWNTYRQMGCSLARPIGGSATNSIDRFFRQRDLPRCRHPSCDPGWSPASANQARPAAFGGQWKESVCTLLRDSLGSRPPPQTIVRRHLASHPPATKPNRRRRRGAGGCLVAFLPDCSRCRFKAGRPEDRSRNRGIPT